MRALITLLAVAAALLVQSALTQVAPGYARAFDPFLLVVVYCSLTGGETHGMLSGAAAGWVQDVHFAGPVVGLSGLTKLVVGFGVGIAGARFLLLGPGPRALALFVATVIDAVLFSRLAALFDVRAAELGPVGLLGRAMVNAAFGAALFELLDRRLRHGVRE